MNLAKEMRDNGVNIKTEKAKVRFQVFENNTGTIEIPIPACTAFIFNVGIRVRKDDLLG